MDRILQVLVTVTDLDKTCAGRTLFRFHLKDIPTEASFPNKGRMKLKHCLASVVFKCRHYA